MVCFQVKLFEIRHGYKSSHGTFLHCIIETSIKSELCLALRNHWNKTSIIVWEWPTALSRHVAPEPPRHVATNSDTVRWSMQEGETSASKPKLAFKTSSAKTNQRRSINSYSNVTDNNHWADDDGDDWFLRRIVVGVVRSRVMTSHHVSWRHTTYRDHSI